MYNILNLIETTNNYSYKEIIEKLKSDSADDFLKIFLMINLEKIENETDFDIFINNLTLQSTPVREICAYRLGELFKNNFLNEFSKNKILDAIVDINPNVSRSICCLIKKNSFLGENLEKNIILRIEDLLAGIKKDKNYLNCNKSHAKNKKFFSLYWLLEALSCCISRKYLAQIKEILNFTIEFLDYTIREKTAKILTFDEIYFKDLLQIAKSDVNFYVKIQVYDKINFDD